VNHFKPSRLPVAFCLAAILVLSGCHKKTVAAAPPPPPTPPPAPTARITVAPADITAGQSATLSWTTTGATQATISGFGTVGASGSRTISPATSADYTLTAKGPGGTADSTARLTVNSAPKPAPVASLTDEQLFQQHMHDVYFNYDRFNLLPQDSTTAEQDAAFLAQHPDMKILIAGHCDERGSEEYNIALGQSRAESLQRALESNGVPAARIRLTSYGKEKPFCTESTEQCWQQNRRDHLTLDR
jgi:peptidoglycan-associated lipoprotein